MKYLTITLIWIIYILLPSLAIADPFSLDIKPSEIHSLEWNTTPNGMLVVRYDLDGNARVDLYTVRIVKRSFFSKRSFENESKNWTNNLIFSINYPSFSYYYVTAKNPLLYAIDLDGDGHWDLMYKDVSEDGLNGNEELYDSPSGMFTINKDRFLLKNVLSEMCECKKVRATSCVLGQADKKS